MLQISTLRTVQPSPLPLLRWRDVPHPERAVARGSLVRLRAGVYAPAEQWTALPPWDRYLARVHAAALARPDIVFAFESAAVLLGIPTFGDPVTVHSLVTPQRGSREISGVRSHRSGADREIVELGSLAMTTPAETAVDLARHRHNAIGLAVADAVLRAEPALSRQSLLAINEERRSARGRDIARWPLTRADALAETALESVSRAVVEWLGFERPELQRTFASRTGERDRADMFWHGERVVGEADGDLKYDGRFGAPQVVMRRQNERDTRLREHVRAIAHWGWTDATTVAPLRSILQSIGLRSIAAEQSAQLFSLRKRLSPR